MHPDDKTEADMAVLVKLFARVPIALVINGLCALGTAAALWPEASSGPLSAWLGLMAVVLWCRLGSWRRFQRRGRQSRKPRTWQRYFMAGSGATGLVWGLTAFVFYGAESEIARTFLPFIVSGMVGGSLLVLTGSLQAFGAFLASALAPYFARFLLLGDETHVVMACMLVVYLGGLLLLARPMCQSLVSSVHLAAINDRLISQLKEKSSQLQATFDHVHQGVAVFDHLGRLITWNPRHRELHGYPIHLYRPGTHLRQFLDQDLARSEGSSENELDPKALAEPLAPARFQQSGAEGRTLAVERSSMPGGGFVSTSTDITDHKRVEARMLHLAQHDPLTDLPNRLLFQDRLQQAMARSTRTGSPIGVIIMDLDGFKAINDSDGHRVGDEALKALARRLRSSLRDTDTLARIGGDEFAFVLPDLTTPAAAARIAEKILSHIETPLRVEEEFIVLRASLGIAMFPTDADNAEGLMRYADLAMYRAKRTGGGSVTFAENLKRRQPPGRQTEEPPKRKAVTG
ncbi:MAG: diguanylate cyclase [Alphaproteobacteria bacterium]